MKTTYQLSVPKPCTENWGQMTSNEQGRFCQHCQKTVIDFTEMTSIEIAQFLHLHENEKICGRILPAQLRESYVHIQPSRSYSPVKQYVAAFLAGLLVFPSFSGCNETIKKPCVSTALTLQLQRKGRVLSGKLMDKATSYPISNLYIFGSNVPYMQERAHLYFLMGYTQYNLQKDSTVQLTEGQKDTLERVQTWLATHQGFAKETDRYSFEFTTDRNGAFEVELPDTLVSSDITFTFRLNEEMQELIGRRKYVEGTHFEYDKRIKTWEGEQTIYFKKDSEAQLGEMVVTPRYTWKLNEIFEVAKKFEKSKK
ncbi:MAG: hypothetical protein ACKVTZ_01205 [Bacteroidia bacterium]